ncbi:hypothetical protein BJ508DRAFT_35528 [Ascobolus immersus RN42]|uniref:CFEM domain-containing protein n=1 Tax=Ascobolus immersus RN42 TaxID=1160509 RepID=A0A3N4HRJ6_ASCIM|nr:hypothetical protein BJ508DRAFT_35528 [Ascobolus immersus RN42]
MRTSLVFLLISAFASTVAAADLTIFDLPKCGDTCVKEGLAQTQCYLSRSCLCKDETLITNSIACVKTRCSQEDATESFTIIKNECLAKGIEVPMLLTELGLQPELAANSTSLLDPETSTTPLPTSPPTTSSPKNDTTTKSTTNTLALALGLTTGLLILLTLAGVLCFLRRRRRQRQQQSEDPTTKRQSLKELPTGFNRRSIYETHAAKVVGGEKRDVAAHHELPAGRLEAVEMEGDMGVVELEGGGGEGGMSGSGLIASG